MKGKLHLIPSFLGEAAPSSILPASVISKISELKYYAVENLRTARRFLKAVDRDIVIDDLTFFEIDKHKQLDFGAMLKPTLEGHDVGLVSEAGMPSIADPGSPMIAKAHEMGIQVVPHVGPSSIILAFGASGMNGQKFSFEGYLPKDQSERSRKLKELEAISRREQRAIAVIETPYRNEHLYDSMMSSLQGSTRVCIACNLTTAEEFVQTKSCAEWKKQAKPALHKKPSVFILEA